MLMQNSFHNCEFFRYACGRWSREHPIPDNKLMNDWSIELYTHVIREVRDLLKVNMSSNEVPWSVMQAKTLFTSYLDVAVFM